MDLSDLFLNQDYVLQDFEYGDTKLQIFCSQSSTTDFDLTGQIIWPSAIELSKFIIDNKEQFQGKNVLELGAGAGLSGVVASLYANNVVITDGNEIVQKLIDQNVEFHMKNGRNLKSRLFLWGKNEAQKLKEELPFKIDVIIGADIIFWSQSVLGLAETIDEFFRDNQELKVYVTGAKRTMQTENDLDQQLKSHGNHKRQVLQEIQTYKQTVYLYHII